MSVTERDREVAERLLPNAMRLYYPDVLDDLAAALAAERERALAPVLAVAEELASHRGGWDADVADLIRRAAQDGES